MRAGAIAGDVFGDDDFKRIVALGIPAFNANTGKECHLDAHLVEHAIEHLPLNDIDILFIENVGNMVCPTDFRLGAEKRIVIVSSTEGDDVVNKHPMMFRDCTIGVINKVDLAPLVGANLDRMESDIHRYNPRMPVFRTNLKTGDGISALLDYNSLVTNLKNRRDMQGEKSPFFFVRHSWCNKQITLVNSLWIWQGTCKQSGNTINNSEGNI